MSWLGKMRDTVSPGRKRSEIQEELELHRALRASDGSGKYFGHPTHLEAATREADVLVWLETWMQDLRHAGRMLRRAPGMAVLVIVSLAVGIGANAAIFSLVNEVLLRTLPLPNPGQVVLLHENDGQRSMPAFSYPVVEAMAAAAAGRAQVGAASSSSTLHLGADARGPEVATQLVTGGYFPALGIEPFAGRWITAADNRSLGVSPVAVLSYPYWQKQFAGDRSLVGRSITLNRAKLTVVGIAPPGFTGLDPARATDVWAPVMMQAALRFQASRWSVDANTDKPWPAQERILWLQPFARLAAPSAAAALAPAWNAILGASWRRMAPDIVQHVEFVAGGRGSDSLRSTYSAPLLALMAMVGMILLIAVANVAALLLARMVRRRREIGIRVALGVSRARLARQLLSEGLLLAALGGVAAVGVSIWLSRLLVTLAAGGGRAPFQPDLDWRVWLFLAAVSLGTGLLLGLLPAWQAYRRGPADALKSGDTRNGSGDRVPLGRTLIVVQIAFTVLLAVGAGLFSRSLAKMMTQNLGFDRDHVLSAEVTLPDPPPAGLATTQRQLLEQIEALPGVRAAAWNVNGLEQNSRETSGVSFPGQAPGRHLQSNEDTVSRDFLASTGITLLRGRDFAPTDQAHTQAVVLVNQAFVRQFYPGQSANAVLGRTFGYDPNTTGQFRIIGVVADARVDDPHTLASPLFFKLDAQTPDAAPQRLQIRTAGAPAALAAPVRALLASHFRVNSVSPLQERLAAMLQRDRLVAELSAGFGLLALALACLGLYGVMSYAVAARRTEFGVRVALGAGRGHVLGLIWRETGLLLGVGLLVGLPLALAAARAAQPLLPGIGAADPVALAGGLAISALLPWLAALRPAWSAATTDPITALRAD